MSGVEQFNQSVMDYSEESLNAVTLDKVKQFVKVHQGMVQVAFGDQVSYELGREREYNFNPDEIFDSAFQSALMVRSHLDGAKDNISAYTYSAGMIALASVTCMMPDRYWESDSTHLDPLSLLQEAHNVLVRQPDGGGLDLQIQSESFDEACRRFEHALTRTLNPGLERTVFGGAFERREQALESLEKIRRGWNQSIQNYFSCMGRKSGDALNVSLP